MEGTWESLTEDQRQYIRSKTRTLTKSEMDKQFSKQDDTVVFHIFRKTDRTLAGGLDIDCLPSNGTDAGESADSAEETEENEIVEITLISPEDFDYEPEVTDTDQKAAKSIDKAMSRFENYYQQDPVTPDEDAAVDAEALELPPMVDHRPNQSPIKYQGRRGTCVAYASLGLLESHDHIPDDLSEQYAHYNFNESLGRKHDINMGLRTTDAARILARPNGMVCEESHWPYISNQNTINQMVSNGTYKPPEEAEKNAIYGYGPEAYKIITDKGLSGKSIKNTRYLESLLCQGYDIVIGIWVSWDDRNNDGILDPVLNERGAPVGFGGHAMLVVGYNRPEQYFIVKNSWGRGWGHDGYAYFHYNLIRSCFKYGFVVDKVLPEASSQLRGSLAEAPYETDKVPRANLSAAILFMRTSRGRHAVCEAYAGDNLLLRNLRVYNADGSVHLERDSLVIRGGYLCNIASGRETTVDADFWWQDGCRPGENYLTPRNGAATHVAFDLAKLDAGQIKATASGPTPISGHDLDYAVIVGRTTANRRFKMLAHAKPDNRLQISYLELFDARGRRHKCASELDIPSSEAYNLDLLQSDGGRYADIRWRLVSHGVGMLESCSRAKIQLLWRL